MPDEVTAAGSALLSALAGYQDSSLREIPPAGTAAASAGPGGAAKATDAEPWDIAVRFGEDTLRNGMDPIGFIRYLGTLGDLASVETRAEAIPQGGGTSTQEAMVAVSTLVEGIRDGSLDLRMVAIGETFQRFQRVVRDVSQQLDKDR